MNRWDALDVLGRGVMFPSCDGATELGEAMSALVGDFGDAFLFSALPEAVRRRNDTLALSMARELFSRGGKLYGMDVPPDGTRLMSLCKTHGCLETGTFLGMLGEPRVGFGDMGWPVDAREQAIFCGVRTRSRNRVWGFPLTAFGDFSNLKEAFVEKTSFLATAWAARIREGMDGRGLRPEVIPAFDLMEKPWFCAVIWAEVHGLDARDEEILCESVGKLANMLGEPMFVGVLPSPTSEEGVAVSLDEEMARNHRLGNGMALPHRFGKRARAGWRADKGWSRRAS